MLHSLAVSLSLPPLFFLPYTVYRAWRTFALIALPISALLIWLTPQYASSTLGGLPLGPDRELVTMWLSGLFVLISYGIILWKALAARGKESQD